MRADFLAAVAWMVLGCAAATQPGAAREGAAPRGFLPSVHGFKFVNRFSGSPLPRSLREDETELGKAVKEAIGSEVPERFGLCGGMSTAAADYYVAGREIPTEANPPAQGTALYEYVHARQVDSFGPSGVMVLKFWQWMHLPDDPEDERSVGVKSVGEVAAIVGKVKAGRIEPMGLVLVKGRMNKAAPGSVEGVLWENHQVLAYGVVEREGGEVDIRVYDPNYPGDDGVVIRCEASSRDGGRVRAYAMTRVTGRGGRTRVRGVFAMPYVPATPPEIGAGPDSSKK